MFCPNCGTENSVGLNYCRSCGLKLDAIVEAVADQLPSQVDAGMQRRKEKAERTALIHLSIVGVICLVISVLLFTQYTNLGYFFGSVLFGAIVLMIFLLVPALGHLYYAKFVLKPKYLPQEAEVPVSTGVTSRLIEDRPFEPAPSSVTEDTTELLKVPVAQDRD
jgi:hypothetical protein